MTDLDLLRAAALRKAADSARVTQSFVHDNAAGIAGCAVEMARRFDAGARLFTIGNGGSACDAQHLAVEFMHPVIERRRAIPAHALATDAALMSAVGNDQDFSFVFADQLRLLARSGDVVVGLSTSGDAANVCRAMGVARELGLLTVGFAGRDGGRLAPLCDHAFVVASYNIHRIQEAHVALLHVLWDLVQIASGAEDVL